MEPSLLELGIEIIPVKHVDEVVNYLWEEPILKKANEILHA